MAFCNKALALAIVHGKGYYDEFITWPFFISIFFYGIQTRFYYFKKAVVLLLYWLMKYGPMEM